MNTNELATMPNEASDDTMSIAPPAAAKRERERGYIIRPGVAEMRCDGKVLATLNVTDLDPRHLLGLGLEGAIRLYLGGATVEAITEGRACPERKPPVDKAALREAARLAKLQAETAPLIAAITECRAALNYSLAFAGQPRLTSPQRAELRDIAHADAVRWVAQLPESEIKRLAETRQVQDKLRPVGPDFADLAAEIGDELNEQQEAAE